MMAKGSERDLDPNASYRDVMRDLIGARFGAVWAAVPSAIDGSDPAGVKAVRVASRRLRAAMDVADNCFPASWYKPLHRSAKVITSELGEVRDRDVILEFLTEELNSAPNAERAGIERLIGRINRERDDARGEMLAFLGELEQDGIAELSTKRFGPDAAAPWMRGEEG